MDMDDTRTLTIQQPPEILQKAGREGSIQPVQPYPGTRDGNAAEGCVPGRILTVMGQHGHVVTTVSGALRQLPGDVLDTAAKWPVELAEMENAHEGNGSGACTTGEAAMSAFRIQK